MIYLDLDKDCATGGFQLFIGDGSSGYRIAGPSYCGQSKNLQRHALTERDAAEIRKYLDAALPPAEPYHEPSDDSESPEDEPRMRVGDLLAAAEEAAEDSGFEDLSACLNSLWLLWSLGEEGDARGALDAVAEPMRAALRAYTAPEAPE